MNDYYQYMARLIKNRNIKRNNPLSGFNPETFPISTDKISGHYIRYNAKECIESGFEISQIQSVHTLDPNFVHWFHIDGFIQEAFFKLIRDTFQIPSFQMADVLNFDHHPKIEDLDDLLFFLLKSADLDHSSRGERIVFYHLGIFLGDRFVLTFSEKPIKSFDSVTERLRQNRGKIREKKEDFLFYSLIDSVVDHYFSVIEVLGGEVEALERNVTADRVDNKILPSLNRLKTEFLYLRKLITPVDESVTLMNNLRAKLFDEDLQDYLMDLQDHSKQLVSVIQGYYTMLNDILQIYTAHINLQTNRILTFLTLFTSIFIPLTFIVGVYGMNFHYMPELDWKYGYPVIWVINIVIAIGMIVFFKIRKWL